MARDYGQPSVKRVAGEPTLSVFGTYFPFLGTFYPFAGLFYPVILCLAHSLRADVELCHSPRHARFNLPVRLTVCIPVHTVLLQRETAQLLAA